MLCYNFSSLVDCCLLTFKLFIWFCNGLESDFENTQAGDLQFIG